MPLPIRTIVSRGVVTDAEGTRYVVIYSDGSKDAFTTDFWLIKMLQGLGLIS